MLIKIIYTVAVFVVCFSIFWKIKDKEEHSFEYFLVTSIISTIIGNVFIPSDISLVDIFKQKEEETLNNVQKDSLEETSTIFTNLDTNLFFIVPISKQKLIESLETTTNITESIKETETIEQLTTPNNSEINVSPIKNTIKSVDNIIDKSLEVNPISIQYYEGNITTNGQIDTYKFIPSLNGCYRFEATDMLSGIKIKIKILNQSGKEIESTSNGIENNNGLTINNMIANETYTIQIEQYDGYSTYKILIGMQKDTVNIDNGITQIVDSIQYKDQKNIYKFTPLLSGCYRFELDEMISGTKVNISIFNPGGKIMEETSNGIFNGSGLTIYNMVPMETYTIVITQYTSNTNYKLLIGYQKETVQIDKETEILDSIQYNAQCNQYQFIPKINGRYRFEISDITSGVEINMNILNQGGVSVDHTSNGISKNNGLTIDNMVAGEIYIIQIIQYNSYSSYKLEIGYQKELVEMNKNKVFDTMQYTHQQNKYLFIPQVSKDYSFEIDKMVSGMKVNISIYNEGGKCIDETSNGIDNNKKLSIKNMIEGERYIIYITQYEGEGSYLMKIN